MIFYYNFKPIFLKIKIKEIFNDYYIYHIEFLKNNNFKNPEMINKKIKILIDKTIDFLDGYFYHKKILFYPPFYIKGTHFQNQIWKTLTNISFGKMITYQELSILAGYPSKYARAVGNACNKNPLPILIPCHRVIGKNHQLIGFSGGLEIKKWLLNHEGCKI